MRFLRLAASGFTALAIAALLTTSPARAASGTLLAVAAEQPNLTTFVSAVNTAGLADMLTSSGPYTVFAPSNEYFANLPSANRDALMSDPVKLRTWLQQFIVADRIRLHSAEQGNLGNATFTTVGGTSLIATTDSNDNLLIGSGRVVNSDLTASNGLLDTIDS
jgi:uncharacterized surface protein with fasciclin (FAS1) repeats